MKLPEKKARLKVLTEPLSATFIEAVEFMAMFVLLNEPLVTKMQCMTQIKLFGGLFRRERDEVHPRGEIEWPSENPVGNRVAAQLRAGNRQLPLCNGILFLADRHVVSPGCNDYIHRPILNRW